MSAAKARTPRNVYELDPAGKVALYNSPGYLHVKKARAALWLLEQLDGGHLAFQHADDQITPDDREDWTRGIAKDAIRDALLEATVQIEEAVMKAATPAERTGPASAPLRPVARRSGAPATSHTS
jgi:hypothetical protein